MDAITIIAGWHEGTDDDERERELFAAAIEQVFAETYGPQYPVEVEVADAHRVSTLMSARPALWGLWDAIAWAETGRAWPDDGNRVHGWEDDATGLTEHIMDRASNLLIDRI